MGVDGIHVLNGSALKQELPDLEGRIIVLKECMIEGNVEGDDFSTIMRNRIKFFSAVYDIDEAAYSEKSLAEISKLKQISDGSDIYLWFEYDLFCQTNFWFSVAMILQQSDYCQLFYVNPMTDSWSGFGAHDGPELSLCFENRQPISKMHQQTIQALWRAYQHHNFEEMRVLGQSLQQLVPPITEVIQAHIDRFPNDQKVGRPEKILQNIFAKDRSGEFSKIFKEFSEQAGIYGFGDVQVRRMAETLGLRFVESLR